jgi:beta-glucosidase-like glycosyl hydrolase
MVLEMDPLRATSANPESPALPPPKPRFRLASRGALKRLAILFALIILLLIYGYFAMIRMPGSSHRGPLPPLTAAQQKLAEQLKADITILADATGGVGRVGNRSTFYPKRFAEAAAWIKD